MSWTGTLRIISQISRVETPQPPTGFDPTRLAIKGAPFPFEAATELLQGQVPPFVDGEPIRVEGALGSEGGVQVIHMVNAHHLPGGRRGAAKKGGRKATAKKAVNEQVSVEKITKKKGDSKPGKEKTPGRNITPGKTARKNSSQEEKASPKPATKKAAKPAAGKTSKRADKKGGKKRQ